jgi:hypothetical protein
VNTATPDSVPALRIPDDDLAGGLRRLHVLRAKALDRGVEIAALQRLEGGFGLAFCAGESRVGIAYKRLGQSGTAGLVPAFRTQRAAHASHALFE